MQTGPLQAGHSAKSNHAVQVQQQQELPALRLPITVGSQELREEQTVTARRRQGKRGGTGCAPMVGPFCAPISRTFFRRRPSGRLFAFGQDRVVVAVTLGDVRAERHVLFHSSPYIRPFGGARLVDRNVRLNDAHQLQVEPAHQIKQPDRFFLAAFDD